MPEKEYNDSIRLKASDIERQIEKYQIKRNFVTRLKAIIIKEETDINMILDTFKNNIQDNVCEDFEIMECFFMNIDIQALEFYEMIINSISEEQIYDLLGRLYKIANTPPHFSNWFNIRARNHHNLLSKAKDRVMEKDLN